MRRWLLTLPALACFLLLFITITFWIRSHWRADDFTRRATKKVPQTDTFTERQNTHEFHVVSSAGGIAIYRFDLLHHPPRSCQRKVAASLGIAAEPNLPASDGHHPVATYVHQQFDPTSARCDHFPNAGGIASNRQRRDLNPHPIAQIQRNTPVTV